MGINRRVADAINQFFKLRLHFLYTLQKQDKQDNTEKVLTHLELC